MNDTKCKQCGYDMVWEGSIINGSLTCQVCKFAKMLNDCLECVEDPSARALQSGGSDGSAPTPPRAPTIREALKGVKPEYAEWDDLS